MLTDTPDKPRGAVFGLRSYGGSRTAFLLTAETLFKQAPGVKLTGDSTIEIYAPEGSTPGYMAASILCESQLSIDDLVKLAHGVEERLADPEHPGARQTLRVDLMWVAGVDLKTSQLELPSPELFTKSWAIGTFMRAAEQAVPTRAESARLLNAFEKVSGPHEVGGVPLLPPELSLDRPLPSQPPQDLWKVQGNDWPDGLAAAAYALGVIALDRAQGKPENPYALLDAKNAAKGIRSERIVPVEASAAGAATDSELARAWLLAVDEALRANELRLATAVIFQASDGRMRGALIGAPAGKLPELPLPGVRADRDPPDSREWAKFHDLPNLTRVTLEVDRSLGDPHSPHGPRAR